MSRYPRAARNSRLKCISCNAPVVETTEGRYVCVDCGDAPIEAGEGQTEGSGRTETREPVST